MPKTRTGRTYDEAPEYDADAYRVAGWGAIAWYIIGWETCPDDDTEWSGTYQRTGKLLARMVGDDAYFALEPSDLTPLGELDYCAECGQVGCRHDGRDRGSA